jgi:hypothetical protein
MNEEKTERFVDESEKPIPNADTWETLSVNQLIDVKSMLETRAWDFRSNAQISGVLKRSIDRITSLIAQRSGL